MKNNFNTELHPNNYVVLLIGVSQYKDSSIHNIENVSQNISQLKNMLMDKDVLGLKESQITTCENKNRTEILTTLNNVCNKARKESNVLLVYFTGHGFAGDDNYSGYLAASDSFEKSISFSGIDIKQFSDIIKNSRAGKKIVLIDACYSGRMVGFMGNNSDSLIKNFDQVKGVAVATSSSDVQTSLYNKKNTDEPTYFTKYLLKNIKEGIDTDKNSLSLDDLMTKIKLDFQDNNINMNPQLKAENGVNNMPFVSNLYNQKSSFKKDFKSASFKFKFITLVTMMITTMVLVMPTNRKELKSIYKLEPVKVERTIEKPVVKKDTIKTKPVVVKKTMEQKADEMAKSEHTYNAALIEYKKLYQANPTEALKNKIDTLECLINSKFDKYMSLVKVFISADGGKNNAIEFLNKALVLKPYDNNAMDMLNSLRF